MYNHQIEIDECDGRLIALDSTLSRDFRATGNFYCQPAERSGALRVCWRRRPRTVAMAAGTVGRPKLSIRAVRAITDETARAYAVSRIATAIAEAEQR